MQIQKLKDGKFTKYSGSNETVMQAHASYQLHFYKHIIHNL